MDGRTPPLVVPTVNSSVEDRADEQKHATPTQTSPISLGVEVNDVCPEGGYGWWVVFGGFFLSMSTFGYIVSYGMFQEYYQVVKLPGVSPSNIAWIGSLQYSLIFLPGLVTGRLFDLGYFKQNLLLATSLLTIANFLIAECKRYWQFVLCQGVLLGLSAGWIYIPCVAVTSHWFKVKRPIAISIISFGSSLGGIIYPIMFRNLIPRIGFQWTVRTFAFINTATFVTANLTLRARLPPSKSADSILNFKAFLSTPYTLYVGSTFLSFLGLYTPLIFLSVSATTIGFSEPAAFYMVAIANGASTIGRIMSGVLALKIGALPVMIALTTVAAIMIYIWPFITSHAGFYVFTVIYGVSTGAFIALFPLPVMHLGESHDVGRRTGMQMSIMALGALAGPPVSGAILQTSHGFHAVGIYAGTMVIGSIVLMTLTKVLVMSRDKQLGRKL